MKSIRRTSSTHTRNRKQSMVAVAEALVVHHSDCPPQAPPHVVDNTQHIRVRISGKSGSFLDLAVDFSEVFLANLHCLQKVVVEERSVSEHCELFVAQLLEV
mmetsp:Transcript_22652/g.57370  ORF Transcript_22652/g.57370 Transcript_22652/m.57370 type:complete len:102 (-) Transcript_22652:41-346(-)